MEPVRDILTDTPPPDDEGAAALLADDDDDAEGLLNADAVLPPSFIIGERTIAECVSRAQHSQFKIDS